MVIAAFASVLVFQVSTVRFMKACFVRKPFYKVSNLSA